MKVTHTNFTEAATDIKAFDIDKHYFINYQRWIKSGKFKIIHRQRNNKLMIIYYKHIDN